MVTESQGAYPNLDYQILGDMYQYVCVCMEVFSIYIFVWFFLCFLKDIIVEFKSILILSRLFSCPKHQVFMATGWHYFIKRTKPILSMDNNDIFWQKPINWLRLMPINMYVVKHVTKQQDKIHEVSFSNSKMFYM